MSSTEIQPQDTAVGVERFHGGFSLLRETVAFISRHGAALALCAIAFSTLYEILLRIFAGHGTRWANEYNTYFLAATAFLGFAATELNGSNIRVTFIFDQLTAKWQHRLETIARWIPLLVTMLVCWRLVHYWHEEYSAGTLAFGLMTTPLWIPQLVMLAGGLLWTIAVTLRAFELSQEPLANWRKFAGIAFILVACALLVLDGFALLRLTPLMLMGISTAALLAAAFAWQGVAGGLTLIGFLFPVSLLLSAISGGATLLVGPLLLLTMLLMLFLSIPVAYTLSAIGLLSVAFLIKPAMITVFGDRAWHPVASFELTAVPMFVLMGALLVRSNASSGLYSAMRILFGRIRGASAIATVMAAGSFAAVSGSSLATAATLGNIAGREMTGQGYSVKLTYGVIAAGGTLGILIPPSLALILYGSIAGVPVTSLFLAGIVPGLVMMGLFISIVTIWSFVSPGSVPREQQYSIAQKLRSSVQIIPFLGLFLLLVLSLALGFATPTEGGAVGVGGAMLICLMNGRLSFETVTEALKETVFVTGFILLIVIGASHLGFAVDFLRITGDFAEWIKTINLSSAPFYVGIVVFYIILGLFLEPLSMLLMTLPLVLPLIEVFGWDLIWFGIILVMLVEVGLITPPVGLILFVLQGIAGRNVSLMQIAAGTLPFVCSFVFAIILFYFFPGIVTGILP